MKTDVKKNSVNVGSNIDDYVSLEIKFSNMASEMKRAVEKLKQNLHHEVAYITRCTIFISHYNALVNSDLNYWSTNFRPFISSNLSYSEKSYEIAIYKIFEILKTEPSGIDFTNVICSVEKKRPTKICSGYFHINNFINDCYSTGIFDIGSDIHMFENDVLHDFNYLATNLCAKDFTFCELLGIILEDIRCKLLTMKSFTKVSKTKNTLFKTINTINSLITSLIYIERIVDQSIIDYNKNIRKTIDTFFKKCINGVDSYDFELAHELSVYMLNVYDSIRHVIKVSDTKTVDYISENNEFESSKSVVILPEFFNSKSEEPKK